MRNIRDFLEFMRNPSDSFDMMTMMVAKSREEDVADDREVQFSDMVTSVRA